ncbi:MAG: cytochrome c peroxidase [Bacteroidota bacterium]|nr:cytochrome c peroxidase [Bacteroidota bacterium]
MKSIFVKFQIILTLIVALIFLSFSNNSLKTNDISEVQLGEKLFFEKALSLDSSISCASCHIPEFAFADTVAFSKGVGGKFGLRNTPSVMNIKFRDRFFYDGRAKDIIDQVHFPIQDPNEMNLAMEEVVKRLKQDIQYSEWFKMVYQTLPNQENIAKAIAAFESTLETANTPFDAFMDDVPNSLNASEIRGKELFLSEKAKCFDCHFGPDFTGDEFKNIGLFDGNKWNDVGRFVITKDSADLGKFKVPGLRNIGVTAPYMHNGSFKTLREVIEYYNNPKKTVSNPINLDESLKEPLNLNEQEITDLINFLLSLTDKQFKNRN